MDANALIVVSANSVEFDRKIGGTRWGSYIVKEPKLLDRETFLSDGNIATTPGKRLLISTNLPDCVLSMIKNLIADLDDVQQHYIICPVVSKEGLNQIQIGVTGTSNSLLDRGGANSIYKTCKREVSEELLLLINHFVLKKFDAKRENKGPSWHCADITVDDVTIHHIHQTYVLKHVKIATPSMLWIMTTDEERSLLSYTEIFST